MTEGGNYNTIQQIFTEDSIQFISQVQLPGKNISRYGYKTEYGAANIAGRYSTANITKFGGYTFAT